MKLVDIFSMTVCVRHHCKAESSNYNINNSPPIRNAAALLQKDVTRYRKIQESRDPVAYIVANNVYGDGYIKTYRPEHFNRYIQFQKHIEKFQIELKVLNKPLNELVRSEGNKPPLLLQMLKNGEVDMMVVLILNQLLKFSARWKQQSFCDDKGWKKLVNRIEMVGKIIRLDHEIDKYKVVIVNHFEPLNNA